jgi:hypothetical protein
VRDPNTETANLRAYERLQNILFFHKCRVLSTCFLLLKKLSILSLFLEIRISKAVRDSKYQKKKKPV